jgi:hypothetical protein
MVYDADMSVGAIKVAVVSGQVLPADLSEKCIPAAGPSSQLPRIPSVVTVDTHASDATRHDG